MLTQRVGRGPGVLGGCVLLTGNKGLLGGCALLTGNKGLLGGCALLTGDKGLLGGCALLTGDSVCGGELGVGGLLPTPFYWG